jgi:uncharacterized protein YjbI with pentapeptide repeats
MRHITIILAIMMAGMLLVPFPHASGQKQEAAEWRGKLKNGHIITKSDLSQILRRHRECLDSSCNKGQRADLRNAELHRADLREAYLIEAEMAGAKLMKANLSGANLTQADLSGADLRDADLSAAVLFSTKLQGTDLREANLRGAQMNGTVIDENTQIDQKWRLVWELVNKGGVGRDLSGVDLSGASLHRAKLSRADLRGANLSEAELLGAELVDADLRKANLHAANLVRADLTRAKLTEANLNKALGAVADFSNSYFEPENVEELVILGAKGLSTIRFLKPKPVVDLRNMARESGLRSQERALTSALRKHRLRTAEQYERIFEYVLLDLPTDSGANPWRSLLTLFLLIPVFSILYMIVLRIPGKDGIWKVWIPERVRKDLGEKKPIRLTLRGPAVLWVGIYFSVLSAFSIGWRELNVGNWIARMQPREYTLRASGWVRTVSGIQSLISVYLTALWLLAYFGRPFQ